MAKIKRTVTPLSGKFADVVHVDSKRYGHHARKPVKPGTKKHEPALREQYVRTKYLNLLASELNTIIKAYCGKFKPSAFYEELHRRFRKEPLNNRFLLLLQLKGMEINPAYPMNKLGLQTTDVQLSKNKLVVNLQVKSHPMQGKHRADCYAYEVLLITWNKKGAVNDSLQVSDWIYMDKGNPEFEFEFALETGTMHWLLGLRQRLGIREQEISSYATEAMQFIDAGSLNKKDYELLEKRVGKGGSGKGGKVENKQVVRVKAKNVL